MARRKVHTHGFYKKFAEVREALKLSHEAIADRSGGALDRVAVLRIESDENKVTSARARAGLARALGVPTELVERALDGKASAAEIIAAAKSRSKSTPPPVPVPGNGDAPKLSVIHSTPNEFSDPEMRWRALVELAGDDHIEEGDALRAILAVPDLSPGASWGDYFSAAKKLIGVVDYVAQGLPPESTRPPRVNSRAQKRR